MLKKRIIGCLILKNNIIVQSCKFKSYLPIGRPDIAAKYLNEWGIDELILIDIEATKENRLIDLSIVEKVSSNCQIPLAVGGGIKKTEDVKNILSAGGDKVIINSKIIDNPKFLSDANEIFGKQCLVASIDVIRKNNKWFVYDYIRKDVFKGSVSYLVNKYQQNGCGELFINSVNKDGTYKGLDLKLIESVKKFIKVPVILCGGIGIPKHFKDGLNNDNVSAVAAANYFHFQEHSVTVVKKYVQETIDIRNENFFNYQNSKLDVKGRLKKKSDKKLDDLLFKKIIMEKI